MFPCLLGYGTISERIAQDPKTVWEGNKYAKWISNYATGEFPEAVRLGRGIARIDIMLACGGLTNYRTYRETCSPAITGAYRTACQDLCEGNQGMFSYFICTLHLD